MSLHKKAMLVRLTVHAWTARRKDKKASREVEQSHNAKDAGNYIKLLIDKEFLQPYQTQEGKIRDYHYQNTLAWGDAGERLLPSKLYMEYTAKMGDLIAEADAIADNFVKHYPTMKAEARTKLGTLYDPMDYPAETDIRRRFGVELDFLPVPDAGDFRVDVAAADAEKIRKSITASVDAKAKQALEECWDRLYAAVGKINEVLTRDKPRIFDSLMTTPEELCIILPKLDISGNPKLATLCDRVRDYLLVQPDDLRDDAGLRVEIGRRAGEVMDEINKARAAT